MTDRECVEFLQWALPHLGLRWPGFRKVRRQVHKRIARRLTELNLTRPSEYRDYLETHSDEWALLDGLSRVSISRFYRDRDVFDHLRDELLPELACAARRRGEPRIRVWSAGCASGEEPYTVAVLWRRHVQPDFPDVSLCMAATDADEHLLQRARRASYPASSLRDAPADWREAAFTRSGAEYVLRPEFRGQVELQRQDIRAEAPAESFHLILCRNLVFTYFADPGQKRVLERIVARLLPGGCFVIGKHEAVPKGMYGLPLCTGRLGIYRAV
jgi:chemotaxis protein methyltransferase CheR